MNFRQKGNSMNKSYRKDLKMRILVEESLKDIQSYLTELGRYEVDTYNIKSQPADVIIYETQTLAKELDNYQENIRENFLNHINTNNRGVLIISARNKTIQELEAILEKRYQEEIF